MAEGLRARQDYLPSGERKRVLFREEDRRTTLRCKQTRQADGRGDGGMKRYEEGGKEVVKVRNKENVQMDPGMSRRIWMESRGSGGCGGERGSPDEQIRRNVGGWGGIEQLKTRANLRID